MYHGNTILHHKIIAKEKLEIDTYLEQTKIDKEKSGLYDKRICIHKYLYGIN